MSKPMYSNYLLAVCCALAALGCHSKNETPPDASGRELPVQLVPNLGNAAESYFSPDGKSLICNAKREGDQVFHTYTVTLDGRDIRKINDLGADACSFYFPGGDRLIFTSTRDNLQLPPGDWSDPQDYPTGAELYTCNLDGSGLVRLTNNEYYEAEVSLSPDGEWVLFARQIDGRMDLWRMRPDGSEQFRITHTDEWQEGGAFYLPDNETILYRAWKRSDEGRRGLPMTIFTIKHDGSGGRQVTHDEGTNWAPYPAPDGKHFVFVKVLPPHNYEIFMMNLDTGAQTRLTYSDAFDGFPSISPDGRTMSFSSSRDAAPGERKLMLYTMDISSLAVR
ncbi:MAG: PD40 domain-containing protein [Candidatus Marinimicrobia bacterium]|nr:PD40 domain-containing protein [Candidatus Neomarinimicrobiota bacterium]